MIPWITRPLTTGELGVDTVGVISAEGAAALYEWGARFVVRYTESLTVAELEGLRDAGLAVMPIRYARTADWSEATGRADGEALARGVLALGLPPAVSAWCDLEGEIPSAQAAIDYVCAFTAAAQSDGLPNVGLYVGAGVPLDGRELYEALPVRAYWRSMSAVPEVERRGYQLLQLLPPNLRIRPQVPPVDVDVAQSDRLGSFARAAI